MRKEVVDPLSTLNHCGAQQMIPLLRTRHMVLSAAHDPSPEAVRCRIAVVLKAVYVVSLWRGEDANALEQLIRVETKSHNNRPHMSIPLEKTLPSSTLNWQLSKLLPPHHHNCRLLARYAGGMRPHA
jgi:hypothetical protein